MKGNVREIFVTSQDEKHVRIWKVAPDVVNYTIFRENIILYGASLHIGEEGECPFCHQEVLENSIKVGQFIFHRQCHDEYFLWWRKNSGRKNSNFSSRKRF
jgi:hypothetical protein